MLARGYRRALVGGGPRRVRGRHGDEHGRAGRDDAGADRDRGRRRRGDRDPRHTYASLTPAGLTRLAEAAPTHVAGVRRLFTDRLSEEEAASLVAAWSRLLAPTPAPAEAAPAGS